MNRSLTAEQWVILGRVALKDLKFEEAIQCARHAERSLQPGDDRTVPREDGTG